MPIYRVTLCTSMLIEATGENDAVAVAKKYRSYETHEGSNWVQSITHITKESQLQPGERDSLPWRSRDVLKEPHITVSEAVRKGLK